ncbi:MAG: hypothetical protein U9R48_10740, partial [Chloroflexota bacterium]|nr:hypothetical protein [Chloroflexota bacterium]
ALLLTGCGKEKSYIPPPATIIRATEEISPTAAKKEQPSATATRSLAPTASSPTESYPYPSALSTPQRTTTPVAYPTK